MLEDSPALEVSCSLRDEYYWILSFAIVSEKEKNDGMAAGEVEAGMTRSAAENGCQNVGSSGEVV